jgi:Uncharacterised protein family (UPF0236)
MELHQEKFDEYLQELQSLQSITNFYDYEKKFSEIHTKFGNKMLELNIKHQSPSTDEKEYKKKIQTKFGEVKIGSSHTFSQSGNGFKQSPLLQELILATCAESPYGLSKELLSKYLDIDTTEMQLYRITTHYGQALGPILEATTSLQPQTKKEDYLYAMADASYVLTREDKWKEVKLGRIFTAANCVQIEGKDNYIKASQYVSHFGDSQTFTQKMEKVVDDYGKLNDKLIFITDGASWLGKWVEDAYPDAISILDFYHAKEYLCHFAKDHFSNDLERSNWIDAQTALLLESQSQQVIDEVYTLNKTHQFASGIKVIKYFSSNLKRMNYAYYKTIGKGLIGSGAIESAHRTVLQCRMKLSGQRWSKEGAEKMICLRTIKMNNQWSEVVNLIKKAA